jgi:hypothetical protein
VTADERVLLNAISASQVTATPTNLGRTLKWPMQKVAQVARPLERGRYITVRRLPKQVSYTISPAGREALAREDGEDGN